MARATTTAPGAGYTGSNVASEILRDRYDRATAHLDPPLALVDLDAFDRNAADMVRRAAGRPIRVASKSLRCRYLIERALKVPGFQGVMCYALPEALWLHASGISDDLLVAYPTVSGSALRALVTDDAARRHITIMVDSIAHLDAIGRVLGDGHPEVRVCLDLDVSWRPIANKALLHIGAWRSPLRTPQQAADFAKAVTLRKGFRLVGVMGYEGQIAGIASQGTEQAQRRGNQLGAGRGKPGVHQRRRNGQPGYNRARRVRYRARGRLRADRPGTVRQLPDILSEARTAVCAAGGTAAR
jgi:D-serine deaminase-like pyridoxal phosphate-dependent protein